MYKKFLLLTVLLLMAALLALLSGCWPASPTPVGTITATLPPARPELVASPMAPLPTPAGQTGEGESSPTTPSDPYELMLFSHTRWDSLWADYEIIDYAGDDANTPLQSVRTQVWLDQPARARLLTGPVGGAPERIWLGDGRRYQETGFEIAELPDLEGLVFVPPPPGSDTIFPHPLAGTLGTRLGDYIFSTPLAQRGGIYRSVGESEWAGRPALVLEYSREPGGPVIDRFWVDAQTGVILRALNFSKPGGAALGSEISASAIVYDLPLDEALFQLGAPLPGEFSPGP